jgi:hypothetical protein
MLLVLAFPAFGQMDWSAVGSVGQVDESSFGLHAFDGPNIAFRPGATGSMWVRYAVTNTFGSAVSAMPPWSVLAMAYVDDGDPTIHARIVKMEMCSGVTTTLCEIKSKDGPSTQCDKCTLAEPVDFGRNVYYVEIDMHRSSANADAVIHHLALY